MKWIVAIVGLLGIAGGCTTTPASPYGATTYAPAYTPGPAYAPAPVYQPQQCACAPAAAPATAIYRPATPYVMPAAYQQSCAPCCN
ncbi:MAG TPA: hypothetical protein VGH32_12440 [Pirellulales bacterium]